MKTARTGMGKLARTASVLTAMVLLSGCSASPTSRYVDSDGREVTVYWRDFPGHAYIDADDILSGPSRERIEPLAEDLMHELESALSSEYRLRWTTFGEAGWHPDGGNGYGGKSAYLTYNSAGRMSNSVPSAPQDWHRIVAIVNGIVADHGFDAVVLDHESSPYGDEEAWQQELRDRFGTDDPDGYWAWTGLASAESQWLSITLTDVARDPSGKAATEAEEYGRAPRSIELAYGATALPESSIEAFRRGLAPFTGLEKPEPTTSD
jgi:hypothetical protein